MMHKLKTKYDVAFDRVCMHEFVVSLEKMKALNGVSAMDIAKAMADRGIHPPTMYFPLIVHEALMVEPTETESKDTIDAVSGVMLELYDLALKDPQSMHAAPSHTVIGRPDEVKAARTPVVRYKSA
jgi:glycine dehydrogenase subunit 2